MCRLQSEAGYEGTAMKSTDSENDSFLKWGLNRNVTPCFGARLVQEETDFTIWLTGPALPVNSATQNL